jgi:hypothetical protein
MRKVILIVGLILLLQLVFWAANAEAAPPESGGFWHRVHYGETLYSLGRRYGVSPYAICTANRLRNCNYIRAGQTLWIPYWRTPQSCYWPCPPHYYRPPWPAGHGYGGYGYPR